MTKIVFMLTFEPFPPNVKVGMCMSLVVFAGMVPFFTRLDACDFLGFNFEFLGEGG